MKKIYSPAILVMAVLMCMDSAAQNCNLLTATFRTHESRCAATGSVRIFASGGSGNYRYRTLGPVNTNFTSSDSITGLSAGTYTVIVNDILTNCNVSINNVVIPGTYQDPRFNLVKTDVSCDNGRNGSIRVTDVQFGRAPFQYRIISPSSFGIGTVNSTGQFNNLPAGSYSIRMTDSCGGIQTRMIIIDNYTWRINAYPFSQSGCRQATGRIEVIDSRGNLSTSGGIPGFQYGVVRSPGDTIWSASPFFSFTLTQSSFGVVAKDSCGTIKSGATAVNMSAQVSASVQTSGFLCNSFNASINSVSNFINPVFCLLDSSGATISCNNTGIFNGISYGRYCITVRDGCTDTVIRRCFTANPPPLSVGNNVRIFNKTCRQFSASVTNQTGLTNPEFCLLDSAGTILACNNTGTFTNLSYGRYCIRTRDNCRDTSITRCFTATPPRPVLYPVAPAYTTCQYFGIVVQGDSLSNPLYCLVDSSGHTVSCNNTGVFDSIPYGNYCITVYDSCYDVTLTSCISLAGPGINNDLRLQVREDRCNSFSIIATSGQFINEYCLYSASGNLLSCNSSGTFSGLSSGNYCVRARVTCPDTIIQRCVRLAGAIPSVGSTVDISNITCNNFTATIRRQQNLGNNPRYCLFDSANVQIGCNNNGVFRNIPFGRYCIRITTDCYDTTIVRCFTRRAIPFDLSVSSNRSCSFGYALFDLNFLNAVLPVQVWVYRPDGSLFFQSTYNRTSASVDSLPGTSGGQRYMLVARDNCGNRDTSYSSASVSRVVHSVQVVPKCPSGTWSTGSGDIRANLSSNMGRITARIVRRNNSILSPAVVPNQVSGAVSTFRDLGPGTYVIRYHEESCNRFLYDTITISPYQYPNLNRSTAYQCDVNGFSVSAIAANGVGPFRYEIIGSVPNTPSIITPQQSSPVFNINNGSTYSLIRLRAVDACGNATLGDASILPLANNGIQATSNCFANPTTLSVDQIFGATYAWFKKERPNANDSTFIDSTRSIFIPMLTAADTGIYICHLVVNAGCIKRTYFFNLNGFCHSILAQGQAILRGQRSGNKNKLFWTGEADATYIIERKLGQTGFVNIGTESGEGSLSFEDQTSYPEAQYRLQIRKHGRIAAYSNTVLLQTGHAEDDFTVFPNPVHDKMLINWQIGKRTSLSVELRTMAGQLVWKNTRPYDGQGPVSIDRPGSLQAGSYFLKVTDINDGNCRSRVIILR